MMPADAKTELTINADANQISGERLLSSNIAADTNVRPAKS
jgi:hypothetical protein